MSRPVLLIPLDDLLSIETVRLELKATWSEPTLDQCIQTICAFANDFQDVNGGYVVLGVAQAPDGTPLLPPQGLAGFNLDDVQKTLFEKCKLITPDYIPITTVETYQQQQLLVIWCPPGQLRPYQAPKSVTEKGGSRHYYIRQNNVTAEAKGQILTQLIQKTNQVPFDDRVNHALTAEVISPTLVRNFLADIGSALITPDYTIPDTELYRSLGLVRPINAHEAPVNVALLMFTDNPERFIRGARIELVELDDDGDSINTQIMRGPLHKQVQQVLNYLEGHSATTIRKLPTSAQTQNTVAFPYEAMREAIVNAVYHRSYESQPDPIIIRLYPDKMEIISYPGPLPGLKQDDFRPNHSPVPQHRNRRLGEFLKQLRLAEMYGTGIRKIFRKMQENGSPQPTFEFDEQRTYFRVVLPAHPRYVLTHILRKSAELWAIGEHQKAIRMLDAAYVTAPTSGALIARLIEYHGNAERGSDTGYSAAEAFFQRVVGNGDLTDAHLIHLAIAKIYLDRNEIEKASAALANIPYPPQSESSIVDWAILYKRAGRYRDAHRVFADSYEQIKDDAKAVHEYAQTKRRLSGQTKDYNARTRLNKEAETLLRRAIALTNESIRKAWCYFDLAKVLCWLKSPSHEVNDAVQHAIELQPEETRFRTWHDRYRRAGTCN